MRLVVQEFKKKQLADISTWSVLGDKVKGGTVLINSVKYVNVIVLLRNIANIRAMCQKEKRL